MQLWCVLIGRRDSDINWQFKPITELLRPFQFTVDWEKMDTGWKWGEGDLCIKSVPCNHSWASLMATKRSAPRERQKDYLKSKPVQESVEDFLCTGPFTRSRDREARNVKTVSGIQWESWREKRMAYKHNKMTEKFQTQQGRINHSPVNHQLSEGRVQAKTYSKISPDL